MDNEEQFEFEVVKDIYTDAIFEDNKVEPIYEEEESLSSNEDFISLEYARRVVETCKEHPKWFFNTIKARFAKVKHPNYIKRCENYVQQQGTHREKWLSVTKYCLE
jgi:hypothetical protein